MTTGAHSSGVNRLRTGTPVAEGSHDGGCDECAVWLGQLRSGLGVRAVASCSWALDRVVVRLVEQAGAPGVSTLPPVADPLSDDDAALALYVLYELHYRGFEGVDEGWEWEPSLLTARAQLEAVMLERLREGVGVHPAPGDVADALLQLIEQGGGRSVSAFLATRGTVEHMREFAVHRSAYQLKEADPHTWAIPRLSGGVKAAMVEIQADEYGAGTERDMHQNLFALTMNELGLDSGYGAYLDLLPATTLAPVNIISSSGCTGAGAGRWSATSPCSR